MNVEGFADWYICHNDISEGYEYQLRVAAKLFARDVSKSVDTITAEDVNLHLREMRAGGLSDSYRSNRKHHLCVLLNEAHKRGWAPQWVAGDVVRVKIKDRRTRGWTVEEVRRLLEAADDLPNIAPFRHPKTNIVRRWWWRSYIMARWDTGLDDKTLRSIERSWIPPHRRLTISRTKTGAVVCVELRPKTIEEIDKTAARSRALIWPLWGSYEAFRKEARKLITHAGLTGSLKYLRSGSGSSVEKNNPGRGHTHLGNGRKVFEKHYELQEITRTEALLPEEL